jgi:predicted DNA-binding ribbon-helix-helix protein
MISTVRKRSILVHRHKTSVSLEDAFWDEVKAIARSRNMTLSDLVSDIDRRRERGNLSSAVRLFVLETSQAKDDMRTDPSDESDPARNDRTDDRPGARNAAGT